MTGARVRPVPVPLLRRIVTRCPFCRVPAPDHLLICLKSAGLLSVRRRHS